MDESSVQSVNSHSSENRGVTSSIAPASLQEGGRPQAPSSGNIYISGNARVHLGDNNTSILDTNSVQDECLEVLLNTLRFPQMHDRVDQVQTAYPQTYSWMLRPHSHPTNHWSCFYTWLNDPCSDSNLYWISGKPGSGKSTLVKFLHAKLQPSDVNLWTGDGQRFVLQHFFWSPGVPLEKSLSGLYRSLLVQILEHRPYPTTVVSERRSAGRLRADWSRGELHRILLASMKSLCTESKVLILIDGLDECSCDDDYQDLLELLDQLRIIENVKICCSSRPWPVFQDAFEEHPRLCLEDLTNVDIHSFVMSKLGTNRRWRLLSSAGDDDAHALIGRIVWKAQGVFLWVSLVVRDILKHLRDGDSLEEMHRKLQLIPNDLNEYFRRIIESIEPAHRREASRLLQLALYEEVGYRSRLGFRLIDTYFVDTSCDDFAVTPAYKQICLDVATEPEQDMLRDTLVRRLNSRCKGLLECGSKNDYKYFPSEEWAVSSEILRQVLSFKVHLLHRSLRDYLLLPEAMPLLLPHTGGKTTDARTYFISSRIAQLETIPALIHSPRAAITMANDLLMALSVSANTAVSLVMTKRVRAIIERLVPYSRNVTRKFLAAPLSGILLQWDREQSNFLSLAIDFHLTAYVLETLTPSSIQDKAGRQYLDHILCHLQSPGRFSFGSEVSLDLLDFALRNGANPNQEAFKAGGDHMDHSPCDPDTNYGKDTHENSCTAKSDGRCQASAWVRFLCFQTDYAHYRREHQDRILSAMKLLVRAGAATSLPLGWLLCEVDCHSSLRGEATFGRTSSVSDIMDSRLFRRRWPTITAQYLRHNVRSGEWEVRASALISCIFRKPTFDTSSFLSEIVALERKDGWDENEEDDLLL